MAWSSESDDAAGTAGTWYEVGKRGRKKQKTAAAAAAVSPRSETPGQSDSVTGSAAHEASKTNGNESNGGVSEMGTSEGNGAAANGKAPEEKAAAGKANTKEDPSSSEGDGREQDDGGNNQERYRHRYQKYLVDELRRVVDELYLMLEFDYNVEDVRKAYQILQTSAHDFANLARRGELQHTAAGDSRDGRDKPQSIAWEVRRTKASPKHMRLLEELSLNGSLRGTGELGAHESPSPPRRGGRQSSNSPQAAPAVEASESLGGMVTPLGSSPVRRRLDIDDVPLGIPCSSPMIANSDTSTLGTSNGDAGSVGEFYFDVNHQGGSNSDTHLAHLDTHSLTSSPTSGKTLSIQAKLMSPERNRKRTPLETKQRAEMKQARAEAAREEHKEALATRLARVADERQAKQIQLADRREKLEKELESRHQRSKELRESHIQTIQQRASEENQKVSEAQFISQLTQENRKLSLQQKLEESEARRREHLESIRQKQKDAEAAAEEAEARRRLAHARREQQKAEAEEKRRTLRKQKAEAQRFLDQAYKENMNRMSKSRKSREQPTGHYFDASSTEHAVKERLQRATTRRREFVAQISDNACLKVSRAKPSSGRVADDGGASGGAPSPSRREKENLETGSAATASVATNDGEQALKGQAWKNRTKKIRRRLSMMSFEPEEAHVRISDDMKSLVHGSTKKFRHSLNWIQRQLTKDKGSVGTLDTLADRHIRRAELFLSEAKKLLDGGAEAEKHAVRLAGFLKALIEVLQNLPPSATVLTASIAKLVAQLLQGVPPNAEYTLCTNITVPLVPILCARLCGVDMAKGSNGIEDIRHATPDDPESVALEGLLMLFSEVIRAPCDTEESLRMHENLLEYLVIFGAIHRLRDFVAFYERQPDLGAAPIPGCIVAALYLLTSMATRKTPGNTPVYSQPPITSPQYIILSSFKHTVISGLVSILTETVLLAGPRSNTSAAVLPSNFAEVSLKLFYFLNSIGRLNLETLQDMMGSSDMRVEAYHLVSFLLSFSTREWKLQPSRRAIYQSIINELLLFIGYFCLLRPTNQDVLHWGSHPTILQKLCDLPFDYFCKPKLMDALMPTLMIACYKHEGNLVVVKEQLNVKHIVNFIDKSETNEGPKEGHSHGDVSALKFKLQDRFPSEKIRAVREFLLAG